MFFNLSSEVIIKKSNIIGVFDIDNTTVDKATRKFLAKCQKNEEVINVSYDLPKSFILCNDKYKKNGRKIKKRRKYKNKLYISQLASTTVIKRNLF